MSLKILFLLSIPLILTSCQLKKEATRDKNCPDLIISEIVKPDWVRDKTVVQVEFKNIGKDSSCPVRAKLYDLDISVKEAKKMGIKDRELWPIRENVSNAKYYRNDDFYKNKEEYSKHLTKYDYDRYIEDFLDLPALQPGEEVSYFFIIKDYWIYDPNCEIEVIVDIENQCEECNETNNTKYFVEGG